MKTLQLYLSDLKELLEAKDFVSARTLLKEVGPIDLADGWEHFAPEERRVIFRLLTRSKANQLFEELDAPFQQELLEGLQQEYVEDLLQELDPSEVGRVARQLPKDMVRHLMGIMKKSRQETVRRFLQYPPQTVGALMRSRFHAVEPNRTTKQALDRIQLGTRLRHIDETFLETLMVVDSAGRLVGTVGLKELVVAPNNMLVRDLMDPAPRVLSPEMDQEEAVQLFRKYKLKSAPVVAADGALLGVVLHGDVFEAASEETEEDFAKMAGISYRLSTRGTYQQALARLPWLVITCLGGLAISTVIKGFEATLSKIIALASFSPLIAGMGGNVGSQTATLVVRGMATGDIRDGDEADVVVQEVLVGLFMGIVYACAAGALSYMLYGARYGARFSIVVGSAMLFSMTMSSLLASFQPFLFRRLGIDPAIATGPLITTTTDILSNLVYFGLAARLLT